MYLLWSGSRGLCWGFRGRSFVLLALTESLRTPAACWTVRNASRVGTQTRSHAFCGALNDLPIRQNWPTNCPDHGRGGSGRR